MAEIKVRLTGDNSDFKRKLAEASSESRAKAREMSEHFAVVREQIAEIGSERGLGQIQSMLGSLTGGAAAFGTALLAGVAAAVNEAMKFETIKTRLGIQLGGPSGQFQSKELMEFITKMWTIGPSKESLATAGSTLAKSGMSMERIKEVLPKLQQISVGTDEPIEDLARAVGFGEEGVMKRVMKNLTTRRAMAASGIKDPVEALLSTGGPGGIYSRSIETMLGTTGGRIEFEKVQFQKDMERLSEFGIALASGDMGKAFPKAFMTSSGQVIMGGNKDLAQPDPGFLKGKKDLSQPYTGIKYLPDVPGSGAPQIPMTSRLWNPYESYGSGMNMPSGGNPSASELNKTMQELNQSIKSVTNLLSMPL